MSIYSFNAVIVSKIYYSFDSFFGIYTFTTTEDIPHLTTDKSSRSNVENALTARSQPQGTLSGQVQKLEIGQTYSIRAEVKAHPKYGHQYVPLQVILKKPNTVEDTITFLTSMCTPRQATEIIERYPNFIQRVIDGDVSFDVSVAPKKLHDIINKIQENYLISDIMVMLIPMGVTYNMIKKITTDTPNPVLLKQLLNENPYILTRIHGLGFKKVDDIALKVNPTLRDSEVRLRALLNFMFSEAANSDGHTLLPQSEIRISISQNAPETMPHLVTLLEDSDLITYVGNLVGLTKSYENESAIYDKIKILGSRCNVTANEGYSINHTEAKMGIIFTPEQEFAILSANQSDFVIISGSAGTGKSTVIQGILDMFHGKSIGICALAAKAAQRVREITGFPAMTIHKMLGWKGSNFSFDVTNPLPYSIVILDEASMVNSHLFRKLVDAIHMTETKLIIVFDHAQLPPIGSGNVATDLLSDTSFKINKFTKIHRQAEKSGILLDANKIRMGENPIEPRIDNASTGELQDMHYKFFNGADKDQRKLDIQAEIVRSFHRAVARYGIDAVVVILPRKQNAVNSTKEVNIIIHDQLFDEYIPSVRVGKRRFAEGARIIQRVNDYERDVINGEIGYICDVQEQNRIFNVKFSDDKVIEYSYENTKDIDLAYALTVHSYQGSQSDVVIIGIDFSHYVLLDNCLLYTAITRAAKQCKIIAEPNAFTYAIKQNKNRDRRTFLSKIIGGNIDSYNPTFTIETKIIDSIPKELRLSFKDGGDEIPEEYANRDSSGENEERELETDPGKNVEKQESIRPPTQRPLI